MDHQLVPVQRTVLLLAAEELASLAEARDLHMCEERLHVPEAGALEPPPSPSGPTAPPPQCAPAPQDLNETLPLDPEVVQLNQFIRQVTNNTVVNLTESYYCMDCSVRESVIFGQKS